MSRPSIALIQERVAARYGAERRELLSASRHRRLTWARHVAMFASRELTFQTLAAIGEAFRRDHSSVWEGCRRVSQRRSDPQVDAEVREVLALCRGDDT